MGNDLRAYSLASSPILSADVVLPRIARVYLSTTRCFGFSSISFQRGPVPKATEKWIFQITRCQPSNLFFQGHSSNL